jgi:uncharacterized protein DUF4953
MASVITNAAKLNYWYSGRGRIEPTGVLNRIRNAQSSVPNNLLSSPRFARLVEQQAVDGASAYSPEEFLAAARSAVWCELDADHVRVDAFRWLRRSEIYAPRIRPGRIAEIRTSVEEAA